MLNSDLRKQRALWEMLNNKHVRNALSAMLNKTRVEIHVNNIKGEVDERK